MQIGTEIRFTLAGTDGDSGDQLLFSAKGLPANSKLDALSGAFRFNPVASQVENYTITFMVSDGKQSASQEVILQVTPATENQITALSSRVLDASAFAAGNVVPIQGVVVTVEGSTVSVTSDANGNFTLSGIPHGKLIVTLDASGVTTSDGIVFANYAGRLPIMENIHNRPYRDYLLPRIDSQGMATVNPVESTTVSNSNIGVTLSVPANTAMKHDGTPYSGPLSVSEVPITATPRELPEFLQPAFMITLQPVGIRFANSGKCDLSQ